MAWVSRSEQTMSTSGSSVWATGEQIDSHTAYAPTLSYAGPLLRPERPPPVPLLTSVPPATLVVVTFLPANCVVIALISRTWTWTESKKTLLTSTSVRSRSLWWFCWLLGNPSVVMSNQPTTLTYCLVIGRYSFNIFPFEFTDLEKDRISWFASSGSMSTAVYWKSQSREKWLWHFWSLAISIWYSQRCHFIPRPDRKNRHGNPRQQPTAQSPSQLPSIPVITSAPARYFI